MAPRASRRSPLVQFVVPLFVAWAVPAGVGAAESTTAMAPGNCPPGICTPAPDVAPQEPLRSRSWVSALATAKNEPIELVMTPVDGARTTTRPGALVPLYVSLGALQAMDLRTTLTGRSSGARETNPLAGTPGRLIAVKAVSMAGTVAIAERAWKKNPAAALVLIVAANSAYAAVVAHNYRVIRQQR